MVGLRAGWTPARIVDILETEGEWMTFAQLDAHFEDRFNVPKVKGTVAQAAHRLLREGVLECRFADSYVPSFDRMTQLQLEVHFVGGDDDE